MTIGHSEAEPFWVEFLRSLTRRGLRGVKLVVSDAHEGLKAAINKVLRCSVQLGKGVACISCATPWLTRETASAASSPPRSAPHSPRTTHRPPANSGARSPTGHGCRNWLR